MTGDARTTASDTSAAARGTAVVLIGRLLVAAMGWACSVVVARSLSAEEWGQFSLIFVLLGLLAVVTDLGVGRVVLAKLIDDDPTEVAETASSFVALRTLLGLVGYAAAVGYVVILDYPSEMVRATAVAGLVVVIATPGHALSVLFQSRHRLSMVAVAETLGQALQLGLTVLAAIFAPYLLIFVIPAVLNELLALVIKIRGVYGKVLGVRPSRRIDVRRWRGMLREAIPLAIGFGLTIAITKVDVLMIGRMDSFDAVGMYSIGFKFSDMMDTLALAVAAPVSTLLVAAWPDRTDVFRRRSRDAAIALTLLGAVAVAAFLPAARPLITLLYGERFSDSAFAAQLLVVGAACTALVIIGMFLLASCGHQRAYPKVALAGLILNIGLNLVLIQRLSYEGAAIATLVTMVAMVVALWAVIARTVPVRGLLPLRSLLGLVVVAAVVAAAGHALVSLTPVPWPVVSVLAVIFVPVVAVALRLTDGIDPRAVLGRGKE